MNMLHTSIQIKDLELSSRLVMPPMATEKSGEGGAVTEQLCAYYGEKSAGGYIGLIITEHSFVNPEGRASKGQLSIAKDSDIAGLAKVAEVIHKNGTKVLAQISHAGGASTKELIGHGPISASAVKSPRAAGAGSLPREMTQSDIDQVVSDFVSGAKRAKEAGFDGVEIHSAHGYLLNQFFSPLTNKRDDAYCGRTISGRIRLHLEIIRAIRQEVGSDYPLALRLGACDYMEGGTTVADSILAAAKLEQAGIDLLDISGGFCGYTPPDTGEQGYFSQISQAVKKAVSIPVLLTGGIVDASAAEHLLMEGKADLIGVGRAILKDSQWAKHAMLV